MNNYFEPERKVAMKDLTNVFGSIERRITGNCVTTAYEIVHNYWENAPTWIKFGRGDRIIPELKNSAVEFQIIRACNMGLLNFTYSIEYNNNSSAKYVKFLSKDSVCCCTVNQTASINSSSRFANFRKEFESLYESRLLLFDDEKNDQENNIEIQTYAEINHGYQNEKPDFAVVGIPDGQHKWFAMAPLLNQFGLNLSLGERKDLKTVVNDLKEFNEKDFEEFYKSKDETE